MPLPAVHSLSYLIRRTRLDSISSFRYHPFFFLDLFFNFMLEWYRTCKVDGPIHLAESGNHVWEFLLFLSLGTLKLKMWPNPSGPGESPTHSITCINTTHQFTKNAPLQKQSRTLIFLVMILMPSLAPSMKYAFEPLHTIHTIVHKCLLPLLIMRWILIHWKCT